MDKESIVQIMEITLEFGSAALLEVLEQFEDGHCITIEEIVTSLADRYAIRGK